MILATIVLYLAAALASTALRRRRLRRMFAGREPAACAATCMEAFPDFDQKRVAQARLWVRQLVWSPEAPIRADDDLWHGLLLDQGSVDDKFESSHEWRGGAGPPELSEEDGPINTVRELMAVVLRYSYEGYSQVVAARNTGP